MQINSVNLNTQLTSGEKNTQAKITEFASELEKQLINTIKTQKPEEPKRDEEVVAFLEQLTSYGAVSYVQQLNLEKIEKLLEEKREQLKESLGLGEGTNPPLEGSARDNALASLEDIMSDYAKELMQRLEAKAELEDKSKSPLASLLS